MKKPRKKTSKRRGRKGSLSVISTAGLVREIDRRRDALEVQRAEANAMIAAIESELASLGATRNGYAAGTRGGRSAVGKGGRKAGVKSSGGGRGARKGSLVSILHGILQGKTMDVAGMMQAAVKAGHKSKSKNFRTIVNLAMLNNRKLFRRVSRGKYTAK